MISGGPRGGTRGEMLPPDSEAADGSAPGAPAATGDGVAVAPSAHAGSLRGADAGRPARRLLDLGLLNFTLLMIGTSSLVAGTWNARRHIEVAQLRGARDRLERERTGLEAAIADERRWYDGMAEDPLLRRELLERLLGPSTEEGIPLSEWLEGGGAAPEA